MGVTWLEYLAVPIPMKRAFGGPISDHNRWPTSNIILRDVNKQLTCVNKQLNAAAANYIIKLLKLLFCNLQCAKKTEMEDTFFSKCPSVNCRLMDVVPSYSLAFTTLCKQVKIFLPVVFASLHFFRMANKSMAPMKGCCAAAEMPNIWLCWFYGWQMAFLEVPTRGSLCGQYQE